MTGATAMTGMTGNDEEPQESMDKILNGQIMLGGVLKENFNDQARKLFKNTLATFIEVPSNKVTITDVVQKKWSTCSRSSSIPSSFVARQCRWSYDRFRCY
jgi:hypothetical protein